MKQAQYDVIAEWYDTLVRDADFAGDLVGSHLFDLIGDIRGLVVCDLACGQGRIARELARRGAQVVGVDLSSELIKIARRDEAAQPLGISYIVDNAEQLASVDEETFDGVVCNLALMDIPDLAATFQAVWRVLRPTSWFVFSITHPCFQAPHARWDMRADGTVWREIGTYFEQGVWFSDNAQGVRGQVGAHHRTLSTYFTTLARSRFGLEQVVEPQASVAAAPNTKDAIPSFMLVRCSKLRN